jgi:outer membrane receptor protein involved in Fe transport
LKLGTDVIWVSSQWFIGDQANQNVKLADYWVANLNGSYQLTKELQIYGFVNNLFNRRFAYLSIALAWHRCAARPDQGVLTAADRVFGR